MNWEAICALGEIAGAVAVVATLLFLSKQIRDTSKQLGLASATDASKLYSDAFWPIYNNQENMHVWTHGLSNPESLDDGQREIYLLFMTRVIAAFDTVVEHYVQGTISDEQMTRYTSFTKTFVVSPGGEVWLENGQYQISSPGRDWLGLP